MKHLTTMFAARLRELMKTTDTTQTALAAVAGVTRQTISHFVNGQNIPDIETFAAIADYFGVSCDYLLGREFKNVDEPLLDKANELLRQAVEDGRVAVILRT